MIKRVLIAEIWFEGKESEYFVFLDSKATDEDYCKVAWEYALDSFAVAPNRRSRYRFTVSDYITNQQRK